MLRCTECGCTSADGRGWVSLLAQDPDDEPWATAVFYCPPCALRQLDRPLRQAYT